jgi:hypothetical protein
VPKNSISKKNCRCTTLARVTMRAFRRLGVLAKDVCRLDGQCVENGSFDSNLILWQIVWREFFLRFGPQLTRLAISSCLLFGGILIFSGGMACTDSWASAARVSFLCLS